MDWSGTLAREKKHESMSRHPSTCKFRESMNNTTIAFKSDVAFSIVSNTSKDHNMFRSYVVSAFSQRSLILDVDSVVLSSQFRSPAKVVCKPSPWMIWFALRAHGIECVDFTKVLLVGDKDKDLLSAQSAGIQFMHVTAFERASFVTPKTGPRRDPYLYLDTCRINEVLVPNCLLV